MDVVLIASRGSSLVLRLLPILELRLGHYRLLHGGVRCGLDWVGARGLFISVSCWWAHITR